MTQQKRSNAPVVRSKYFSIFGSSTTRNENKKVKVHHDPEFSLVPETILKVEAKKEQCPLCQAYIPIESVSMEVHVNVCLDTQQGEEQFSTTQSVSCSSSSLDWKEKFSFQKGEKQIDEQVKEEEQELGDQIIEEEKEMDDQVKQEEKEIKDQVENEKIPENETIVEEKKENMIERGIGLGRLLPDSWKNLFSASDKPVPVPLEVKNANTTLKTPSPNTKTPKARPCPFYKRIKNTRFTVDAFNFGKISDCDAYFLTHYHADHYGGLRSNWSHGPIYCSQVTANLIKQELCVKPNYVHALPMNEFVSILGSNVSVALIDANHCPGSVLFLFVIQHNDGTKTRHLHTGDFRASPKMCLHPLIRQPENGPIHTLYLDTTYMSPQYAFPAQEECIQAVCHIVKEEMNLVPVVKKPSVLESWIQKKPVTEPMTQTMNKGRSRALIVVGTYTIGKERVFINIARMLQCKVYAPYRKTRILKCQEDKELMSMLTDNPLEAQVHVVPLRNIRADIMSKYLFDHKACFDKLIAFKPTGWTYKSTSVETSDMKLAPLSHIIMPPTDRTLSIEPHYNNNKLKFYGVPYSEHSSFRELASFIASLDIQYILPTVNLNKVQDMSNYFTKWQQEKTSKRIEVVSFPSEDHW